MTRDPSTPGSPPGSIGQRDADGRLRHLITLDGLTAAELTELLDLAQFYVRQPGDLPARDQSLSGHTVANLFFEPSTRTRVSFELAALRLGADVVNLDMQSSSRVKGETVLDTIYTLQAMHADILVMRDAEPGLPAYVAAVRRAARLHPQRRRSAPVASDAGAARRADGAPGEGRLLAAAGADRRRHQPLARRALGLAGVHDARRRRAAHRGAATT